MFAPPTLIVTYKYTYGFRIRFGTGMRIGIGKGTKTGIGIDVSLRILIGIRVERCTKVLTKFIIKFIRWFWCINKTRTDNRS